MPAAQDPLHGLTILERGWLSSNNTLIHAAPGEPGALLVDTGHSNHADQTVALVRQALTARPGEALSGIVNTHLHSDHCGGNAALQSAFGVPVAIPPGQAEAMIHWRQDELSWHATGQRMDRFEVQQVLQPGEPLRAGGRDWQVLEAPGHDPDSVMLFDPAAGVLLSADALWENGFGIVFPEVVGEPGFDDVEAVLDLIAALPVKVVVPGHGRPFGDAPAALARARSRLAAYRTDPRKHARYCVKVLLKYHLMEERQQPWPDLLAWAAGAPMMVHVWQRFGSPLAGDSAEAWVTRAAEELVAAGAVTLRDGVAQDA